MYTHLQAFWIELMRRVSRPLNEYKFIQIQLSSNQPISLIVHRQTYNRY